MVTDSAVGPNDTPLFRLVDVHKRFDRLVVLDGINLSLRRGETTVIIGESGAGKSVILKHMVRILKPGRFVEGRCPDDVLESLNVKGQQ